MVILCLLSSEAWHSSRMHADHFNYDRAYSSKGLSFYICHVNVLFVCYCGPHCRIVLY